ncbi:MAG: SUMF1/EgtB/PvdO family nonheme iron enzyme, partial [Fibrobacteres bacterium]|nr:SUMF1/EgtB/PvdO family nonheme iron enzyme [Fibrobacterota bacterium]
MRKTTLLTALVFFSVFLILCCTRNFNNPVDPNSERALPPTPRNLQLFAIPGQHKIQGRFSYIYQNGSAIVVERSLKSRNIFYAIDTIVGDTLYIDSVGLSDSTDYEYRLCGINSNGRSNYSMTVEIRTSVFEHQDKFGPFLTAKNGSNDILGQDTVFADTLTLNGDVNDPSGVDSLKIQINGGIWIDLNKPAWVKNITLTEFMNTLIFRSKDSLGNISLDTSIIFVDDSNFVNPVSVDTVNGMIRLSWNKYPQKDYRTLKIFVSQEYPTDIVLQTSLVPLVNPSDTFVFYTPETKSKIYTFSIAEEDNFGKQSSSVLFPAVYSGKIVGMKRIPGGTFQMGDSYRFPAVHSVTISSFFMDSTEVTQYEFKRLMNVNPSAFKGNDLRPVDSVTWFDAVLYCNARSKKEGKDTVYTYTSLTGVPGNGCSNLAGIQIRYNVNGYRLPTEAEWEYACRAGSANQWFWNEVWDFTVAKTYCWYVDNSNSSSQPVGVKK